MKFCMVTTFFPPYHWGGDAVFVARLSEALARNGHTVDVVHDVDAYAASGGTAPQGDYDPPPGVTVHALRSSFGRLSPLMTHQTGRALLKGPLRELLETAHYDVVHFHNISLIGLDALSWPRDAVRLLTTHEHWLVCPTSILWRFDRELCDGPQCVRCTLQAGRPPQWWRGGTFMRQHLAELDAVIAPSRFTADAHRERGLDLPFDVLPHFVPRQPVESAPRPHERPYFLYVGRLEKAKGVHTLFSAFQGANGADLVIVGDGTYRAQLSEMASTLPRVRFVGRQPLEGLDAWYRHALAVTVPSLCYEVFGMVIIEAFATGTPVIARDRGALAEIVRESDGGLLFATDQELHDAVTRIETDPALRLSLAVNGARTLEQQWTVERHLEHYFAIIARAVARRRSRGASA